MFPFLQKATCAFHGRLTKWFLTTAVGGNGQSLSATISLLAESKAIGIIVIVWFNKVQNLLTRPSIPKFVP